MNPFFMIGFAIVAALFVVRKAEASARTSAPSDMIDAPGQSDWFYMDDNQYYGGGGTSTTVESGPVFAPATMLDPQYWGGGATIEVESIPEPSSVATPLWEYPPEATPYIELIEASERAYGLPPRLLGRLLWQESRFNPRAVNPASGAKGIAQFLLPAAEQMGITDRFDPQQAIPGAAKYLQWLRGLTNNWRETLAAYNWGIGNVQRSGMQSLPAETRAYLKIADDVGVA